jgi:hypothetical protein
MPSSFGLTVTKAEDQDWQSLNMLLERANNYAYEKSGFYQWTVMPHVFGELKEQLNSGCIFVIKNRRSKIIASISITEEDDEMWDEEGLDNKALYFHKLMKDPRLAPKNAALALIGFTASKAISQKRQFLRIDAKKKMFGLVNYYKRLGFDDIRELAHPVLGDEAVLMQADPHNVLNKIAELNKG